MSAAVSLFGKPVELNDAWINNHKDHSLCWMNHTVFEDKKKIGSKFRECICYTCRKVARELLEQVNEIKATVAPEKKVKKKPGKKKKQMHQMFFGSY